LKVFLGIDELVGNRPDAAVTIGNFYALHKGHHSLIERVKSRAKAVGALSTVVTFEPHPQAVLHGQTPPLLVTAQKKIELLQDAGVEQTLVLAFTEDFAHLEPEEFITDILLKSLKLKALVVGADFRFGRFARGDSQMLRSFGRAFGYRFENARIVSVEGRRISSTAIRHALAEGDLAWANKALGRSYCVSGTVVRGKGRGKNLGFPTANLAPDEHACIPAAGIFAGRLIAGKIQSPAAISIGTNPTFGDNPLTIEAFVLEGGPDLYGDRVEFEFVSRLRDHVEFPTANALKDAMAQDVAQVRKLVK